MDGQIMIQNLNKSFALVVDAGKFDIHVSIIAILKQTPDAARHRNLNIAICIEEQGTTEYNTATIFMHYRSRVDIDETMEEFVHITQGEDTTLTVGTWTNQAAEAVLKVINNLFEWRDPNDYDVYIELRDQFASVLEY